MAKDSYKSLIESIAISKKTINQLNTQMDGMDRMFTQTIESLSGEDKQKVQTLKAMVNRVIAKAKRGEDYSEAIDKIKETFKKDLKNGSKSNG